MGLVDYGSDSAQSDSDSVGSPVQTDDVFNLASLGRKSKGKKRKEKAAPAAQSAPAVVVIDSGSVVTRPTDSVVYFNPTYEELTRPVLGPKDNLGETRLEKNNTYTGFVEQQAFNDLTFREQQKSFEVLGYARNPLTHGIVGDVAQARANSGALVDDMRPSKKQLRETRKRRLNKGQLGEFDSEESEDEAAEEEADGDAGVAGEEGEGEGGGAKATTVAPPKAKRVKESREYQGPWARWEEPEAEREAAEAAAATAAADAASAAAGPVAPVPRKRAIIDDPHADAKRSEDAVVFGMEKSTFHGQNLYDYLGRSYLHIPTDTDTNLNSSDAPTQCYTPKRCIHTWTGHTKGVSRIKLFPKSGHLVLSGSLDTRIKLWDVYHEGGCLRTFQGHSKGISDLAFDNDGRTFLSASYDRHMKIWDSETGQCTASLPIDGIPHCAVFYPENTNLVLAGTSSKKIVQFDTRSGELVQEYASHLGPVNTITFVDDNRRFVTTSDDKSIRMWDFDIPVVIKYVADPMMHSMPSVTRQGKHLAMQSLDNQVLVYDADSLKANRKKSFKGHTIAGYACEPHFSPNGQFISSGDGQGNIYFWDYKTGRILNKIRAHNKALISHEWLPHETSKVITSSWDGLIKLWD